MPMHIKISISNDTSFPLPPEEVLERTRQMTKKERKEGKKKLKKNGVPTAEKAKVLVKLQDEWDNDYCIGLN